MPADVLEALLKSGRTARFAGRAYRPLEHPQLPGQPLSVQRGQAEAFYLAATDGTIWILKKFHPGRNPDRDYLLTVRSLLPRHDGFACGTHRAVLSGSMLERGNGCYHCRDFADWLEGTILMPKIEGIDWAGLADDLRSGQLQLDSAQRIALCRGLTALVALLEQCGCAHRDLSSGNLFICLPPLMCLLIDFDSLYHPSLLMPQETTCGTAGYVPPYAWQNKSLDPAASWRPQSDRYGLAILNAELLTLTKDAPLTSEGGMFDQDELRARSGRTINLARSILQADFPGALPLFDAALQSQSFDQCPPPQQWFDFCQIASGPRFLPPALSDLEEAKADFFTRLLRKRRPPAPLWPAPSLNQLPPVKLHLPPASPVVPAVRVAVPADPWASVGARMP